jgi:hypothetical protein
MMVRFGPWSFGLVKCEGPAGEPGLVLFIASSSILPNGPKLNTRLFSTFISCVLMELLDLGAAGGLDKVFVGFLEVGWCKQLKSG